MGVTIVRACVSMCVYKGVNLVGVEGGEGVRSKRCGDKSKSFHRIQQNTKIGHFPQPAMISFKYS